MSADDMVKKNRPPSQIPEVGQGKRGLDGHLLYLLRQAATLVRAAVDRVLAEEGTTLPQFSALTMISSYEGLSGADLARLSMLTPQTVNLIVRNLEQRGMVQREDDPAHGKILRLQVTADGRRLLRKCRAKTDKIESRLRALGAEKQEVAATRRWLVKAACAFDQANGVANDKRNRPRTAVRG